MKFIVGVALMFAMSSHALPITQRVDSPRSQVRLSSESAIVPISGSLRDFSGHVSFELGMREIHRLSFSAKIDDFSLENSSPQVLWLFQTLIRNMPTSMVFFSGDRIRTLSDDRFEVSGTLIAGRKREPLTIPVTILSLGKDHSQFKGSLRGALSPGDNAAKIAGILDFNIVTIKENSADLRPH